ncbi:class E sortase [Catenulispora subtropica]|uniref:Class E sortase n=1 Tax=Catenulispora subtropica TaxID=450798 RepID=A0ABN2RVX7_9ACTN
MARVGAVLRGTVRTVGELLVTFSVLTALFIVYQLYYTNLVGRQVMDDEVGAMHRQWTASAAAAPPAPPTPPVRSAATPPSPTAVPPATSGAPAPQTAAPVAAPPSTPSALLRNGSYVAILHIPRLGSGADGSGIPVLEGIGMDVLNKATGHYPGTALPGQVGNFAVAGHRKTHGEPFRHLDELRAGDLVTVETAKAWFTYEIDADPVIVQPSDVGVLAPVPGRSLITLTTCNPWWSSTQRMIVTGHLVSSRSRT